MTEINPLAAWRPQGSPAAPRDENNNPLAAFRPTSAPASEQGRSAGEYFGEMISNVPGSAAQVGKDLWNAVTSPVETAQAIGGAAIGGVQLLKDQLGVPSMGLLGGDQRDKARAVGDFYGQRYGGTDAIADTFRQDPVGGALDIGGLLTGGAAAGARLPGVAGKLAAAITKADPVEAAGRGMARGVKAFQNRTPSNKKFIDEAPTPEALQRQGSQLFEAAEKSGIRFKSADYDSFVDTALSRMVDEGADKILSPKVSRVADILADSKGSTPSIQQMSILRRQFGNAAGSTDKAEARLGAIGVDLVDEFVESGASTVGGTLGEARGIWSRLKKSEIIDTAIENAGAAQAGIEAGLRAEFKTLWRARNSSKMRGFTDAEMAAIKAVATGNVTTNTLRRIGSLGGGLDQGRNMLNLMGGVAGGAAVGGPVGAAMVPAAGYVAARLAKSQTQGRAALARAITARGETPRQAAAIPPPSSAAARLPQQTLDAAMRRYPPLAKFLEAGMRRRYPQGSGAIAAPVAVGAERSQDPRFRGIR